MTDNRPKVPSDPSIKGIRLQHPTDSTKVIQLELIDTGLLTSDSIERWAVGAAIVPGPTSTGPNAETTLAMPLTGGTDALPPTTDARSVWIQNDPANLNDVLIFGVMNLGPGENIVIPTGNDASWITFKGTALDNLNYAILRRV